VRDALANTLIGVMIWLPVILVATLAVRYVLRGRSNSRGAGWP
jgi:hypothetical protein